MPASPALGRIGGHLLKENLERHGIDLAFRNTPTDDATLYLRVDPNVQVIVASTNLKEKSWYKIRTLDGSDFTLAGSPANVVGTVFQATGPVPPKSYDLTQVVNGTFDTDISNWTAGGGGTLSWNPLGYLTVDASGGVSSYAQQIINVDAGGDYRFIATHITGGIDSPTTDFSIQIFDDTFTINYANISKTDLAGLGTPGTIVFDFVPTTAAVAIRFSAFNCAPNWDNVSLRKITDSNGTVFEIMDAGDPNPFSSGVNGVGVNTDDPAYMFDVNSNINSVNVSVTNRINVDNIIIDAPGNYFTTSVGPINIVPSGADPVIFMDRLATDGLFFTDNIIGTNGTDESLILQPNGAGTNQLQANTNLTGELFVERDILITGDLSFTENLVLGDSTLATVKVNADLSQGLIPGQDNAFDLGQDARDSSPRRWSEIHVPDLTNINNLVPLAIEYSSQTRIDGVTKTISALQSNDDIELLPDTGINYIEDIKIEGNFLTNLINMPALDATAVANGMNAALAGTIPEAVAFWSNTQVDAIQIIVTGPGSTETTNRIGPAGDVYADPGNPGFNADDVTRVTNIINGTGGTYNEQLYFEEVKDLIYGDATLYAEYGNGADLNATPITIGSTNNGYVKYTGTNGVVIPAGTTAERAYSEVGETRWNTDLQYLECFDGSVYYISTGAGEVVSADLMTELAISRALMLG